MANQDDVRRLAMALPGAIAATSGFAFSVEVKGKEKGFAWVWQERVHPKKPRVPNALVLAVRVANETEKSALLGADADKFFTEPHYNGFPAILVRLPAISPPELGHLLAQAWRCMAPRPLVAAYDAGELAPASPPRTRAPTAPRRATRATSRKAPASSQRGSATAAAPRKRTAATTTSPRKRRSR